MTTCDHCDQPTRTIYPVMVKAPLSPAEAMDPDRILPRSALEALGFEIPWGEHPDDDRFEAWCERCKGGVVEHA